MSTNSLRSPTLSPGLVAPYCLSSVTCPSEINPPIFTQSWKKHGAPLCPRCQEEYIIINLYLVGGKIIKLD